eukprot:755577-Hanusia_phi.AAC.1
MRIATSLLMIMVVMAVVVVVVIVVVPHLKELHLENNRLTSLRGLQPQPALEKIWVKGNPVCENKFINAMCLMAVGDFVDGVKPSLLTFVAGSSLLRIDDSGIVPKMRELAMVLGPRAAEAVREVVVVVDDDDDDDGNDDTDIPLFRAGLQIQFSEERTAEQRMLSEKKKNATPGRQANSVERSTSRNRGSDQHAE